MKTLINISGGAIKFIGLISAFNRLIEKGVRPAYITGCSSGAIVAFLHCCGRIKEGVEMARNSDDLSIIYSKRKSPIGNFSGLSFRAIIRIILGKNYLGEMDNLEKNIRKVATLGDFIAYKYDKKSPDCYILAIDSKSGKHIMKNIKKLGYNEAIDMVMASSSIAPIIKARKFQGLELVDGGHRGHSAGAYLLKNNILGKKTKIGRCITIFSRPCPEEYEKQELGGTDNLVERLQNVTIGASIKETSLNDEYVEENECEEKGIDYIPMYLSKFTNHTYIITKDQIKAGEKIGIEAVDKALG